MNCDEFRARYLAGESPDATDVHLAECAACRSHREDLKAGRKALMDPAIWTEPPPELEDQVVALIAANHARVAPRSGRVAPWVRPLAAAALALVVVGIYGVVRTPQPDWEVELSGTDLAPLAISTVSGWNTDSGTRMLIAVDGLDPAPVGYFYEFWLSQGPHHISAGTFTGDGEIALWTGVTRAEFPHLWVTLEPIDDNESPSGNTVLNTEA